MPAMVHSAWARLDRDRARMSHVVRRAPSIRRCAKPRIEQQSQALGHSIVPFVRSRGTSGGTTPSPPPLPQARLNVPALRRSPTLASLTHAVKQVEPRDWLVLQERLLTARARNPLRDSPRLRPHTVWAYKCVDAFTLFSVEGRTRGTCLCWPHGRGQQRT